MALNRRKGSATVVWTGDWSHFPAVLTAQHLAAIQGVGVECIWDRCQRRTMRPRPDSWSAPRYRWQKSRVQAETDAGAQA